MSLYLDRQNKKRAESILGGSLSSYCNIAASGSIQGMVKRFGWERGGSIRHRGYIYHIGKDNVRKIKQFLR